MKIIKNSDDYIITIGSKNGIVNFNSAVAQAATATTGAIIKTADVNGNEILIKSWGSDNLTPNNIEKMLYNSTMAPQFITTQRNLAVGQGLYTYYEIFENKKRIVEEIEMPTEIQEFFEASEGNLYFTKTATEIYKHKNYFTELIPSQGASVGLGTKQVIAKIKSQPCRYIRAEQMNENGMIANYYWRGDAWAARSDEKRTFYPKKILAYNDDFLLDPNIFKNNNILYHYYDTSFTDEYYGRAWGGIEKWLRLAELIPTFHLANLSNGYLPRFQVEIPIDYFDDVIAQPSEDVTTKEYQQRLAKKKKEFLNQLDTFLRGEENVGRTIITFYYRDIESGKTLDGVKIKPLDIKIQDEALLRLFEKANQALMAGIGIHPTLSNIETQGRLSSGGEIRNVFTVAKSQLHSLRDAMLKPYYIAKKVNNWDVKIKFGFRDSVLTTLSDEPTGMKTANSL